MSILKYLFLSGLVTVFLTITSCSKSASNYHAAGDRFLAEGNFADAALNYRNAIQKQPNNPEAAFGLGTAELGQSNLRAAREAFSRAVTLRPNYREAMVSLAEVNLFLFVDDPRRPAVLYERAAQLLKQLAESDPNDFDVLRLQGQIAQLDRHSDQAIELLTRANTQKPFDRRVCLPLVQSLLAANRTEEAIKFADAALTKDPQFSPLYDLFYRFYISSNRPVDAETLLKRKVVALPNQVDARIQLAGFYAAGDQQAEAKNALKPIFDRLKEFPDANLRVAEMYLSIQKPLEALRYLEEGVRSDVPRKAAYLKRLCALAWAQNDHKKAIAYARSAVENAPDDDEARRFRASFLLEAGTRDDLPSVIEDYSRLLKKSPRDRILNNQLGQAYRAKGDVESAWRYLQIAIQDSPTYLTPRLSLAELSAERLDNEQTLRYLDEILSLDKTNSRIRLFRVSTLRILNRLPDARRDVQALLAAEPNNVDVQIESGLLYLAEKRPREAELAFAKLYHPGSTDVRRIIGLAEAYASQKDFPKAVKLLASEVQRAPKDVGPRIALARMIARSGDLNSAMDHYRHLITAQPNVALYHLESGQLLLSQGNFSQAVGSLQKAASIAPKDSFIHFTLATGLHSARRLDEARKHYQQAFMLDSNNLDLLNNFAYLCAEQGTDLASGVAMAQKAIAKDADNPSYSDTLGLLYLKQKDADRALQVLRPIVSKHPHSASFRLHLAMALYEKGLRDEAKQELKTALTKQPSTEDASIIRDLLAQLG